MNSFFNKKSPIEYIIEVNIYYQDHRKRMEIDVIEGKKQSVILEMLQLTYHNPEIDQRIREVKMTRYLEKCGKQWRPKQGKSEWEKQKEEEKKRREKEIRRKETKEERRKKKKEIMIEIKKIAEKQEIWDEEKEAVKSEEEARNLVPERFHK